MKKKLGALLAILPIAVALSACGNGGTPSGPETKDGKTIVKIAITKEQDVNKVLKEEAAKQDIDVEYKELNNYTEANPQLTQGAVDLNWFQHISYLANYNVDNDDDLQIVGPTAIFPMGLYSKNHKSVDEIPQGGKIAIPNDAVNEARAINLLKAAHLLKLKDDSVIQPSEKDIDKDNSKVEVTAVEANQTVTSMASVDGSVVNNDFLDDAGLDPKNALYQDDPSQESALPYVNVFVAQKGQEDNETYKKLIDIYRSKPVQEAQQRSSKNTAVVVDTDVQKLRDTQKKLEDEDKKNEDK
ncbi:MULTISPECIES: MetQ/NlpA family ABC transporter substrate-binding protein [Kocuria]|uniref:MetQ/NlpA family ABC transporter substrate-binding protein n=1 Tax=Kocuria TaxID=57493 RepID=UPI0006604635|nr:MULTISPECIES: MetQ/NlpA family ABC transporter substrate-binding protein [Kocuria]MCT1368304.1 MetQ/NlpA family ABC transporter substrate-binding protein [Rothia sp. p3-SID1597]